MGVGSRGKAGTMGRRVVEGAKCGGQSTLSSPHMSTGGGALLAPCQLQGGLQQQVVEQVLLPHPIVMLLLDEGLLLGHDPPCWTMMWPNVRTLYCSLPSSWPCMWISCLTDTSSPRSR